MSKPKLPECLKEKLEFGNTKQIWAIREYEQDLEEYYGTGDSKRWEVYIEVGYDEIVGITAETKEEAIDLVKDGFDISDCHVSFSAREIPFEHPKEIKTEKIQLCLI